MQVNLFCPFIYAKKLLALYDLRFLWRAIRGSRSVFRGTFLANLNSTSQIILFLGFELVLIAVVAERGITYTRVSTPKTLSASSECSGSEGR
jgi:hypothetical protein